MPIMGGGPVMMCRTPAITYLPLEKLQSHPYGSLAVFLSDHSAEREVATDVESGKGSSTVQGRFSTLGSSRYET